MYHSNCRSGACICVTAIISVLAAAAGGLLYAFVSLPDLLYAVIAMLAVAAVVLLFAGLMAVLFCCCGHTGCANSCVRAVPITAAGTILFSLLLLARGISSAAGSSVNVLNAILFALAFGFFVAMMVALVWWIICALACHSHHTHACAQTSSSSCSCS